MRTTRIHVELPLAAGTELQLPPAASAHLLRVLRLREGAALVLFNGRGGEYPGRLLAGERNLARVALGEHRAVERESPLAVTLLQGIARGERMDLIIQKATELGAAGIAPLSCEFSVVRLEEAAVAKKRERWQSVAVSACEQSGRNRVPPVHPIMGLEDACIELAPGPGGLRLMLVPDAPESLASACAAAFGPASAGPASASPASASLASVQLLVGPEGGLSGREVLLAQRAGYIACRLGPRVLRTETAPLAALAVLQALAGDLAT
jgi:16S rRNA (uracil1498-N3)-methyltransferase